MPIPTITDMIAITDPAVLLTGAAVFSARIFDVSIGTVRTIFTVQGRTALAFALAVVEVTVWITVVSAVINKVGEMPVLIFFYSFGYATGNVVGILVERRLAFGMTILKVISMTHGREIADSLRKAGQPVTLFVGEGMKGPVLELYIACRRRDLKWMIAKVFELDQNAFYIIEQARDVNRVLKPVNTLLGGWRQRHNRK